MYDDNGCLESETNLHIEVREEYSLDFPQAFSPNGDNISDVIKPRGWGLESLEEFKVYNRWGELLFETNDLNNAWDGDYNKKPQPNGTYVYFVSARTLKDEIISKKGNFLLLR
ncbi:MAG TPA: gliding motility-associated C-terminal domain-containing protein [Bacteroidetes bacterium]|nr:gliding motility-associated C-terminal domain-containing protein [Bacteroidota bacterium]